MLHEQFRTLVAFKYLVALKTMLHEIKSSVAFIYLVALKTMLHEIKTLVAIKTILHDIKTLVAIKTILHDIKTLVAIETIKTMLHKQLTTLVAFKIFSCFEDNDSRHKNLSYNKDNKDNASRTVDNLSCLTIK